MSGILIVDDNANIRRLLRSFVETNTVFEVCGEAENGPEGFEKAEELRPDLILLDLMLPDLDGISICELLRRQPATCEIPIIMITALGGEIARLAAFDSGVNDYLRKPFSPRELVKHVDGLLRGYESKIRSEENEKQNSSNWG